MFGVLVTPFKQSESKVTNSLVSFPTDISCVFQFNLDNPISIIHFNANSIAYENIYNTPQNASHIIMCSDS
jgi:hypothetical protein